MNKRKNFYHLTQPILWSRFIVLGFFFGECVNGIDGQVDLSSIWEGKGIEMERDKMGEKSATNNFKSDGVS